MLGGFLYNKNNNNNNNSNNNNNDDDDDIDDNNNNKKCYLTGKKIVLCLLHQEGVRSTCQRLDVYLRLSR